MKKAKRFNDGGLSLEEMYPEAKITRAGPQPKPVEEPPKTRLQEVMREMKDAELKEMSKKAELAPYERKAEKFSRSSGRGGGGGGGGGADLPPGFTPGKKGGSRGFLDYKKGGKVSSASKRGDGIAQRGKTKGRMV